MIQIELVYLLCTADSLVNSIFLDHTWAQKEGGENTVWLNATGFRFHLECCHVR